MGNNFFVVVGSVLALLKAVSSHGNRMYAFAKLSDSVCLPGMTCAAVGHTKLLSSVWRLTGKP
jgi:hypothetical protein